MLSYYADGSIFGILKTVSELINRKIHVVRHGQTDYNLKSIVQGSGVDSCINENGLRQAAAFYEANKHINFDRCYYTGLRRTKQTVASFLEKGMPAEAVADLNEICWGDYEGVPMDEKENRYYQDMVRRWSEGELDHSIAGGESPNQAYKRIKRGIEYILSQEGETILICMHGRAMRILLCILLNYPLQYMDIFEHQNLCCYQLTQLGDFHFRLDCFTSTPVLEEVT